MAGLTSEGLVIKTRSEIYQEIQDAIKSRITSDWDDVSNNVVNIYSNIISEQLSSAWGGIQGAYDAAFPSTAYDVSLDNVSDIVNVQRIPASQSFTQLQVTGVVGSIVPVDTVVTVTDTNERFTTQSTLTLQSTRFSDVVFQINSVVNSTVYELTIGGVSVSINSGVGATASSILNSLKSAIDLNVPAVTTSLPTSTTLRVNVTEPNSVLSLVVGNRIGIVNISDLVQVKAVKYGEIKAPAGTIVNLLVPIAGISSVTNLLDVSEGRERETDSQLRARRYESVAIIGASTEQAILANIRNLEGVTAAFIIPNRTFAVDSDGRPPKSFEVVVEGGDEDEIANAIWEYHPVGIETFGSITRTVLDDTNTEQLIKFSRPITRYVRMQIEYTKYTEEQFNLSGGNDAIEQAALVYGETLNVGVDIHPQRFFGPIFSSVQGLSTLTVRVSTSLDLSTWSAYTTSPVPVGKTERASFDISRITASEV